MRQHFVPLFAHAKKAFRVPLEHAEEQSSSARTSDGRSKASRCVRTFVPFAGRETSVVSLAGSSRGSALQTPAQPIGDQEMLETASSTGSPSLERILDSGLSARADDGSRSQGRREIVHRTARSLGPVGAPPLTRQVSMTREPERRETPVVLPCDEGRVGPRAIRRPGTDRAPARPAGEARYRPFELGRAHDRIVVAEVVRTASSSWKRAAPGDRGGAAEAKRSGGQLPRRE